MRPITRLHRAAVTGIVAVVALLILPSGAWAQNDAEISISKDRAQIGDQIQVVGTGFEPGSCFSVQVCGVADELGRLT